MELHMFSRTLLSLDEQIHRLSAFATLCNLPVVVYANHPISHGVQETGSVLSISPSVVVEWATL